MDNVVDQIRYDHISMSRILYMVEQELAKLKSMMDVDFALMFDCMRYMKDYAEAVHHPKEDAMMDYLYGAIPELDLVIDEIRLQHGSMAKKSDAFIDVIESALMEQFLEKSKILSLGHDYLRGQRSHIRLEEESILRKAKGMLSENEHCVINLKYADDCDPQIKDNFEQEYSSLYRSLTGS